MYQNVIFDFYGTLVDVKTNEDEAWVWEKLSLFMNYQGTHFTGETLKEAYQVAVDKYLARLSDKEYPEIDVLDVFFRLYKDHETKTSPKLLKQTARMFRALTTEHLEVYEGVVDLLESLKKKGCKLFLLSNAQRSYLMPEIKMLGLFGYFDKIYISSNHGIAKPDPNFYELVITENDLKKKETIMIGNDYSTDIKGAHKVGIDSLYIQTQTSNLKAKKVEATYEILDGDHQQILPIVLNTKAAI